MRILKFLAGVGLTVALMACGGGGGNPGTPLGTTAASGGVVATAVAVPASFVFTLDKSSIGNGGGDWALLTVTTLDAARNVLAGVPVTVAVDSGAYAPVITTTDAAGQVTGSISIGSDKSDRTIAATISVAGLASGVASVAVVGSQISLTAIPSTPTPGASVQVAVKATDVNGAAISGATIQIGGTLGFSQNVTTDPSGNATATLAAAPSVVATYSVTATGLGISATRDVQVVGAGAAGIPVANGVISSHSLAITPNTISPNTLGSTTNRTGLRAVFQTATNQAIQNVRVKFVIDPPGLGSGEQISTGTSVVYSDASGVAIADYIPGTRSSPTNGVTIRACYGVTDLEIAATCDATNSNSVTASLTVAGQPLSISLGDNNLLSKGGGGLTYIKQFDVAVADAAGNAVANALVTASVDITHYGKGPYAAVSAVGGRYQVTGTLPVNTLTGGITQNIPVANGISLIPTLATGRVWCPNEDQNRNGFLDGLAEDINGDGAITPRKADIVLSFAGSNVTGTNGRTIIQVEYPQSVATWLSYSVRVTTGVAGSEGTAVKSYVTDFILGDDANGSFLTPPYGIAICSVGN